MWIQKVAGQSFIKYKIPQDTLWSIILTVLVSRAYQDLWKVVCSHAINLKEMLQEKRKSKVHNFIKWLLLMQAHHECVYATEQYKHQKTRRSLSSGYQLCLERLVLIVKILFFANLNETLLKPSLSTVLCCWPLFW